MWVTRENVCVLCVRGSVSLNRGKHMQRGGMRSAAHFPLKAACATCAHACECVHVEQCSPRSRFPFLSTPDGVVFHWAGHSILRHTRSVLQSTVKTKKVHIQQRGCARLVLCCKTTQGWSDNRQSYENKIKKLLCTVTIINLIFRCSFALLCFTQQFFCSNSSVMAHTYKSVMVSLNH